MPTACYDLCSWCGGQGDDGTGWRCIHCDGSGMVDLNDFADDPVEDWPNDE